MDEKGLRESLLFRGLGEPEQEALAELARGRDLEAEAVVFDVGNEADELLVVSRGRIDLYVGLEILGVRREIPLESAGPGAVVGWSALVPPHRLTLSGNATVATSVWVFDRAELRKRFEESPALGLQVMRNLAAVVGQRFQNMQEMWREEAQRRLSERYK